MAVAVHTRSADIGSAVTRKPPSLVRQLLANRLAVVGFALVGFFAFVAIAAPVLAPPPENARDPMKIPRDGFGTVPLPPGSPWVRNAPPLPFWWTPLTGLDHWTHVFGVASGGWDIYYGVVWGTRTAFIGGIIITFATVLIGVIVGTLSAYYGGPVDTVLQRMTEVFLAGFFCGCFVDELANRRVALHRSPLAGPHIALHASQNPAIFIGQDFLSDCAATAPEVHLLLLLWPIVGGGLG